MLAKHEKPPRLAAQRHEPPACDLRAPCAAVRGGRSGPQGDRQGCRSLFAGAGAPSKSPAAPHVPVGLKARQAPSGGALSFGYFSLLRASCPPPFGPASPFARAPARAWASKRKVTRASHGTSFASSADDRNARCV